MGVRSAGTLVPAPVRRPIHGRTNSRTRAAEFLARISRRRPSDGRSLRRYVWTALRRIAPPNGRTFRQNDQRGAQLRSCDDNLQDRPVSGSTLGGVGRETSTRLRVPHAGLARGAAADLWIRSRRLYDHSARRLPDQWSGSVLRVEPDYWAATGIPPILGPLRAAGGPPLGAGEPAR